MSSTFTFIKAEGNWGSPVNFCNKIMALLTLPHVCSDFVMNQNSSRSLNTTELLLQVSAQAPSSVTSSGSSHWT